MYIVNLFKPKNNSGKYTDELLYTEPEETGYEHSLIEDVAEVEEVVYDESD